MAILEITHLSKKYKDVTALVDVNLKVRAGEFVTVIGRSGAGKSTLLRCVNRLVEANSGRIEFDGVEVLKLRKSDLRHLRTRIGMIFQHFNLVYRLTVIENVLHGRLGYMRGVDGIVGRYSELDK
ncbi:MAG TPA: ATP-binding cassette domain-containing protein, partial [Spirochaetia bacterium]|nr:ATP-binding cassette domain-containing protein [Spirochaetia bacterium]